MFGKEPSKRGSFAGLSRSGEHDNGAGPRGAFQAWFNVAGNPHVLNIQSDCMFCIT